MKLKSLAASIALSLISVANAANYQMRVALEVIQTQKAPAENWVKSGWVETAWVKSSEAPECTIKNATTDKSNASKTYTDETYNRTYSCLQRYDNTRNEIETDTISGTTRIIDSMTQTKYVSEIKTEAVAGVKAVEPYCLAANEPLYKNMTSSTEGTVQWYGLSAMKYKKEAGGTCAGTQYVTQTNQYFVLELSKPKSAFPLNGKEILTINGKNYAYRSVVIDASGFYIFTFDGLLIDPATVPDVGPGVPIPTVSFRFGY